MEPMQYVRLLRRRWLTIFLVAAIGAAVGYASTLLQNNDDEAVTDFWAAGEVLVVNQDGPGATNLQGLAVFATGGDVPQTVAEARGVPTNELIAALRTVSDNAENTITISAVDSTAADARNIAEQVTLALLEKLNADAVTAHDQAIADAEALVGDSLAHVGDLDQQISVLDSRQSAASDSEATEADDGLSNDGLSDDEVAELSSLNVQRDLGLVRIVNAEDALSDLQRTGPTPALLVRLEPVVPFRISQGEYEGRLAQGEQADNNFDAGEVKLADTSLPTVSELIESPAARAVLGALAGVVLGIALVITHRRLDPRLRNRDEVEAAFALPVLAEIPVIARKNRKDGVLLARDQPNGAIAEAYRYLRSVLLFAKSGMTGAQRADGNGSEPAPSALSSGPEREVRVVMVTSAGEGEGKTTTALNLAVLMAEAGHNTILVNCDFRLPTAHKAFGLPYTPGTIVDTGVENLRFISDVRRGEGDTPGQVSERQRKVIRKARRLVDLVILDTAPILATNDAIDILPETDLVVLVAREAKTTGEAASEARELLIERMGVPVAGVVVSAAGAGMSAGYYEKYRYGSYFRSDSPALWKVGAKLVGRNNGSPAEPQRAAKAAKRPKARKQKRRGAKNGVPSRAAPRHQTTTGPKPVPAPPPAHIGRTAPLAADTRLAPPPRAATPSASSSPTPSNGAHTAVATPTAVMAEPNLIDDTIDLTQELDDLFAPLPDVDLTGARHAQPAPPTEDTLEPEIDLRD